jgi:hypothetical protein
MDTGIQFTEIPMIEKITQDEKWLLGEIRGTEINDDDPELTNRVIDVVLRYGAEMRMIASGKK